MKKILILSFLFLIGCGDNNPGYLMNLSLEQLRNENNKIKTLRIQNPSDGELLSLDVISSYLINEKPKFELEEFIINYEELEKRWIQLHNGYPIETVKEIFVNEHIGPNQQLIKVHEGKFEDVDVIMFFTLQVNNELTEGMSCVSLMTRFSKDILKVDCGDSRKKVMEWNNIPNSPKIYID